MSKGISSGHSLKALAHPLQQFIAAWGNRERPAPAGAKQTLPAPYALAALRGEAILRQRFFAEFIELLPFTLDAGQQLDLWQSLVEEGGVITAWIQRLGIAQALRREAVLPENAANESRQLYTLLLFALAEQAPDLLPQAVERYFLHVWRARFPNSVKSAEKPLQATVLRDRLSRALRRSYGEAVEVKESFTQTPEQVCFSLLAKRASGAHWETLVTLERPRLKTARLAAYGEAIEVLTSQKGQ